MKGTHLLVQGLVFIDATHFSPGLALCGEGTRNFQNTFYNQAISRFMQYNTFNCQTLSKSHCPALSLLQDATVSYISNYLIYKCLTSTIEYIT